MTTKEFYETIKAYAAKEMAEQAKKAAEAQNGAEVLIHQGACNEAEKFYRMIEAMFVID